MMKVYKLEVIVLDFDCVGNEIKEIIENANYPNHCIHPDVRKIESRDIGEWHDDHALNKFETYDTEIDRLFGEANANQ